MLDDVVHELRMDDLVFVDPLSSFLPGHAKEVMPFFGGGSEGKRGDRADIRSEPESRQLRRQALRHFAGGAPAWRLAHHLPAASGVEYYADVVLAVPPAVAQSGPAVESLRLRLERFAKHLRAVLFPFEVQVVEAPGSNAGSQRRSRRVQALHRLFELFDGNDPAAEVRRLKLEDEGA